VTPKHCGARTSEVWTPRNNPPRTTVTRERSTETHPREWQHNGEDAETATEIRRQLQTSCGAHPGFCL
jgi:hypothetical protein